jgi:hypothetical protein
VRAALFLVSPCACTFSAAVCAAALVPPPDRRTSRSRSEVMHPNLLAFAPQPAPSSQSLVAPCGAALLSGPLAHTMSVCSCVHQAQFRDRAQPGCGSCCAALPVLNFTARRGAEGAPLFSCFGHCAAADCCSTRVPASRRRPSPACACRCSAGSYWASAKDAAKPTQLVLGLRGRVGRLGPDWPISREKIGHVRVDNGAWG